MYMSMVGVEWGWGRCRGGDGRGVAGGNRWCEKTGRVALAEGAYGGQNRANRGCEV